MSIPLPEPVAEGPTMPVPQPRSELEAIILVIERMARDPATDMAKVPPLLELMQTLMQERARIRFFEAFAKLQATLPAVVMTGAVVIPGRKTQKYITLEDVIGAFKKPGGENGFSITGRESYPAPQVVAVTTTLAHEGGHFLETTVQAGYDKSGGKNDIQSLGSAISYARRYGQLTLLNIAGVGEDDDGQSTGTAEDTVTEEQAEEIRALIKLGGNVIDEAAALAYLKVSNWGELPAKRFDAVVRDLKRKAGK